MLPWQCFRLRAPGYLYWSVKHWPGQNTSTTDKEHGWSSWRWAEGARTRFVPLPEAGSGWPALPWITSSPNLVPGDGYVAYPGPRGEPLSSIRLEAFRDGVEDVEYLFLLRERAEAAREAGEAANAERAERLLGRAESLISPRGEYEPDISQFAALREEMGEELARK